MPDTVNFNVILARLDDQREVSAQRHAENVERLRRIEDEVRRTNGRVTRNEEQIKTLFRQDEGQQASGETVTLSRLKWYAVCVGAGFGGALWLMRLLGKL